MRKFKLNHMIFASVALFVGFTLTSCEEEVVENEEVLATFQYEISETNFLEVSFTNFSSNATTYSWDFGDGTGTSQEESPTYTYSATGTYTVTLTASNDAGDSRTASQEIEITDPNEALTLLAGLESKTWKLFREGVSIGVGPSAENPSGFFGLTNNGSRNCLYEQEFTFTRDGSYIFDDNGAFWGEFGVWPNDNPNYEKCFDATPENMVINVGGSDVDLSAWLSATHAYEYDASTGELTLNGEGAWIVVPKLGTDGEHGATIVNSVTCNISIEEFEGYDVMTVEFDYGDLFWFGKYASYTTAQEPDLFEPAGPFTEINMDNEDDGYTWTAFEGNASVSVIENPDKSGINTSDNVLQFNRGTVTYSGMVSVLGNGGTLDYTGKSVIKIKVWAPEGTGNVLKVKLEIPGGQGQEIDFDMATKGEWVEYEWDLSADLNGNPVENNLYQNIVVFPDFGSEAQNTFYVDDIILE